MVGNSPYSVPAGHSADVRINLHVNGSVLPIGQIGGGRFILRGEAAIAHDQGVVVMSIDGIEYRWEARFEPSTVPTSEYAAALRPLA